MPSFRHLSTACLGAKCRRLAAVRRDDGDHGLLVVGTVTNTTSPTVPSGSVISQTPSAGAQVASGSQVTLVVSTGLPPVTVPNVVGSTQPAATTALTNAGLTVGNVSTGSSGTVPSGSVISQNPGSGSQVAPNSAINLVVSTGPAQVVVPNVVNLAQMAATTAIVGTGLVVGTVNHTFSATVPSGSVISQNPVGGTLLLQGAAVDMVVSTGPAPASVPNVVGMTQAAATSAITGVGLVVGAVTNASSATVPSGSVISESPVAGSLLPLGSAVSLVISTGPAADIAIDATVFSDGLGVRTTPSFTTTAPGAVLLAFAAADGPSIANSQTLQISGAGLTWTLVRRVNQRFGTSEIWKATATAPLTNVTVTSTLANNSFRQSLTVVAFKGATGVGASVTANGATGAPTVTLVTTAAGSLVYGVGNDWSRSVARTIGANQTMVHQVVDAAVGDTFWVQARTGTITAAGTSVQINDTAPTNDQWNFASVKIMR